MKKLSLEEHQKISGGTNSFMTNLCAFSAGFLFIAYTKPDIVYFVKEDTYSDPNHIQVVLISQK